MHLPEKVEKEKRGAWSRAHRRAAWKGQSRGEISCKKREGSAWVRESWEAGRHLAEGQGRSASTVPGSWKVSWIPAISYPVAIMQTKIAVTEVLNFP